MVSLYSSIQDFYFTHHSKQTYWIAYSGGLDSHVLLHLMAQLRTQFPINLKALYINHSLSPNAAAWAAHCAEECRQLKIDFTTRTINAKAAMGESPEETAREGRYAVFAELLTADDIILSAHHQDDQAETLLLQLMRGSGPKGLAAMPVIKPLGKSLLGRPLLKHTRAELLAYAEQNQLVWINDESNANTDFSRNFIRHDILAVLKNRWASIPATLARTAQHCAEAQALLNEMAAEDLAKVLGSKPKTLSVQALLDLSEMRQRQVLRYWLESLSFPLPSTVKLNQIQQDMLHARFDKSPHLSWDKVELRRYQDDIYALDQRSELAIQQVYPWDFLKPLDIKGVGTLTAISSRGEGLRADLLDVSVRFRRGGEVCHLPGRLCTHSLKKLLQEWQIPPWERNRLPLIYVANRLAAIPGLYLNEELAAKGNEVGYKLVCSA